jgi:hypothetical protein
MTLFKNMVRSQLFTPRHSRSGGNPVEFSESIEIDPIDFINDFDRMGSGETEQLFGGE